MTRLQFRLAEMVLVPVGLLAVDGLTHLVDGKAFMSEYLWGGLTAVVLLRGLDALRAATHQWPETR